MAQVVYSTEAFADLERLLEFLLAQSASAAADALEQVQSAIVVLERHPRIGRRVDGPRRELVITHGTTGYLALYRYDAASQVVRVLRIRHQREAGYRD